MKKNSLYPLEFDYHLTQEMNTRGIPSKCVNLCASPGI